MVSMFKYAVKYFVTIFSLLVLSVSVSGQFYNGLQMNFGKNRIQYGEFIGNITGSTGSILILMNMEKI